VKLFLACTLAVFAAAPIAAQTRRPATREETPKLSLRPFFLATVEQFTAKTTFDAAFGQSTGPFFGAGAQLTLRNGLFVDVAASRFQKTGQRAFVSDGQTFQLGIPLEATLTPFEVTAGYRFGAATFSRIVPYIGAGVGRYAYEETSGFAADGETVDAHHAGYQAVGGVEFRVHKWIAVSVDAQYTHVPGILGLGGVSKDAGETDLGGIAARFRVLVGR
jgi:opacity protein-like surface antigen